MTEWLGKLLGIEGLKSFQDVRIQFASPWAQNRPALVLFACAALAVGAFVFYLRFQPIRRHRARVGMALFRSLLLAGLVWILAEPVVALTVRQNPRPLLLMLFDGTDSMNISDRLSSASQEQLQGALGPACPKFPANADGPTRQELVQAAVRSEKMGLLRALGKKFRCRGYVLDQRDKIRELSLPQDGDVEAGELAAAARDIKGHADVTALGMALDNLRRRSRSHLLAGVVVVSDFNQNRGQPALPAAKRLKAPVYTVGLGPPEAVDLALDLRTPLVLKKGEKAGVTVLLRQTGLEGRSVTIELRARKMGTVGGEVEESKFVLAAPTKTVQLDRWEQDATLTYEPDQVGRFTLEVKVKPFGDEVLTENNTAQREVVVRDESLKLLFVEYEPTWEWRFVKEVFHRHPMIGREGFRTYLDSADFVVRRGNDLFLETLVRSREEFFSYDVIFLSDVPPRMLSPHFQQMVQEYVGRFGGGIVVLSGPRFGPGALADTKIGDMLPVVLSRTPQRRDGRFALRLTPQASQFEFMNLGAGERENREAWANFYDMQWYQQCLRPHPLSTVLAIHPVDRCVDGKTPQPLIAARRYGKGEVIYFAFNEIWRLRRMYGEKYYSQFWGQLIYRLGLGRALGSQKRFRVETDRHVYQAGQKVQITVEAYDRNYEPLRGDRLEGRILSPGATAGAESAERKIAVPLSRDKVIYETSLPVFSTGLHRLMVRDPVTLEEVEVTFRVAPALAERRSAVRGTAAQRLLAEQTGGRAYELHEIGRLADDIQQRETVQTTERRLLLWNTWLVFSLLVLLMLGEWLARKLLNLQ